jgi:hypothetical protein
MVIQMDFDATPTTSAERTDQKRGMIEEKAGIGRLSTKCRVSKE